MDEEIDIFEREANTQEFICSFLDPKHNWQDPTGVVNLKFIDKWQNLLSWVDIVDWEFISFFIRGYMEYKDFLGTQYWKILAEKKRLDAKFMCQKCKKKGVLNVHHTNYDIHGLEIFNLNKLVVLCECCHRVEHKIDEI